MQDDFVSMLAHELRTPLTSIRAFTEILLGEPEMELEQRNKLLGIIVSETDRLTQLISQALDVAKLESGRTEWNATRVDMKEVICDAVSAMNQVFEERQIEVAVRAPDGQRDHGRCRQDHSGDDEPPLQCGQILRTRRRPHRSRVVGASGKSARRRAR